VKANWDKLIALLTEMVDLYQAILELSRQKRELLIAVKPQDLEAVTKQEELLILQVGKLESARSRLTKDIAAAAGRPSAALTLAELKELAGPEDAERLEDIAADLDRIMQELAPINQLNTELIQRALGFINYNLNLLTQSAASPTYAADGRNPQENHQRKLVDRKI
jgi:flagellar biosynthesis/type III secretory pathway chaperone